MHRRPRRTASTSASSVLHPCAPAPRLCDRRRIFTAGAGTPLGRWYPKRLQPAAPPRPRPRPRHIPAAEMRCLQAYCPMFSTNICRTCRIPSPGDSAQLIAADAYAAPPLWMALVHLMWFSYPSNIDVDPAWSPSAEIPPWVLARHDTSVQLLVTALGFMNTSSITLVLPALCPVSAQVTKAVPDDSLTRPSGLTRILPS